jgi:integrase
VEKTTFEDLKEGLTNDYRVNGKKSLERMQGAIAHLDGSFGLRRALDIRTSDVTRYIVDRQRDHAANATINRELAALKRMFRLGLRAGLVAQVPVISLLRENNTRKGFFELEQFRGVLAFLPDDLHPLFEVAYETGWRVQAELLPLTWAQVDLHAGWMRLEPGADSTHRDHWVHAIVITRSRAS